MYKENYAFEQNPFYILCNNFIKKKKQVKNLIKVAKLNEFFNPSISNMKKFTNEQL